MQDFYREGQAYYDEQNYEAAVSIFSQKDSPKCQCGFALCYRHGSGVEKNEEKAKQLFSANAKALHSLAEQNDADAQYFLGLCYQNGWGVVQDFNKAAKLFSQAAEQDHPLAQDELSCCYFDGTGVEKSREKGRFWAIRAEGILAAEYCVEPDQIWHDTRLSLKEKFEKYCEEAEKGNAISQNNLGVCYMKGRGIERSCEEAERLFVKAAEQAVPAACWNLYNFYKYCLSKEKNLSDESKQKAESCFLTAVELENAAAQNAMGRRAEGILFNDGDAIEASIWYAKAAAQAHPEAQYNLGRLYKNGKGVEQNYDKALELFEAAAAQGYTLAWRGVAECYYIKQLYATAIACCEKMGKDDYASLLLGNCYFEGTGVEKNPERAFEYYQNATHEPEGCYQLAQCYLGGFGTKKDLQQALYWMEKAANMGYECEDALALLRIEISPNNNKPETPIERFAKEVQAKNFSPQERHDCIVADLKKEFKGTWRILSEVGKGFLISGMTAYLCFLELGEGTYQHLDFSAAVLPMCKALEYEFGRYIYTDYISYLKSRGIPPENIPKGCSITRESKSGNVIYNTDRREFGLGGLRYYMALLNGRDADGREYISANRYFLEYFDTICREDAFSGKSRRAEMLDYLKRLCEGSKTLADYYRNPAAHSEKIPYNKATECANNLLKVKKMLYKFLSKLKISSDK